MTTLGPNSPGDATNLLVHGNWAWSDPTNILADDASYATNHASAGRTPADLTATGFDLGIGANQIVVGLTVTVKCVRVAGTHQLFCRIRKADGTYSDEKTIAITSSETVFTLGGAADLWGFTAVLGSELVEQDFDEAVVVIYGESAGASSVNNFSVNHVTMSATVAAIVTGPPPVEIAPTGPSQSLGVAVGFFRPEIAPAASLVAEAAAATGLDGWTTYGQGTYGAGLYGGQGAGTTPFGSGAAVAPLVVAGAAVAS